jgi:thiosulfate/3-mercaptopyruvate sulfurtransferase
MKNALNSIAFILTIITAPLLHANPLPSPLIETNWLASNLNKVVIIDVRTDLKSFTTKPVFIKDKKNGKRKLIKIGGHIPGARMINYKKIRSTVMINGQKVQKMLPSKEKFEKIIQVSGINKDSKIIIVAKGKKSGDISMATRLYWQLKYFGHDDIAILNGGMAQWILDGRKLSYSANKPAKGNWLATAARKDILASTEDVTKSLNNHSIQIIDNRSIDLYLGTWRKPYVKGKGHIPGAKLYPSSIFTSHGIPAKFMNVDQVKALSKGLGIDPEKETITYCNSGHLSSGGWFIMHELLGNNHVKVYDGSMHEWILNNGNVKTMTVE